ncbi:MAG: hypothetical protein HYZ89_08335 [Candidatus Omnitrophica bacterium]|nr:hypothetical protein [Candidatus Omnitrophota bacterium]
MGAGKPTSLALIICDAVIDDRDTNKKTLVGLFSNIGTRKLPFRHPALHVFVSLTDGNGAYKARLECRHRDSDDRVFELKGDIKFDNPNQVVDINFALQGVVFSKVGIHNFDFYLDEQIIVSRKFTVNLKTEQP